MDIGQVSLNSIIFLPFLFAFVIPFIYKIIHPKVHLGWLVLIVPAIVFAVFLYNIPTIAKGEVLQSGLSWFPSAGIDLAFYVDGLALLFGLLISGIGILVVLYSVFYMSKTREALHTFYIYLLMFMGAMMGLVFSDNIFVLYGFWELTSVSSFLLIAYWYERKASRKGALKSLMITVSGGLAMFAGFIMLMLMADTVSIQEIIANADLIRDHALFIPSLVCILLGAFTKSAQFPFGIWLPDAMEAPTPVSAYLHSATMVKAGIYLVARLTPVFAGNAVWFWLVAGTGIITLLYGSVSAIRQTDLKALLAYSTISQLGLIMSLLGIGSLSYAYEDHEFMALYSLAIFAAIFHLFNHSTFKGSLFMVVGIIDLKTGTRDIRRLGGLMTIMPVSFTVALIGSFSMAGLPPFNGFLSKEMFFTAVNNLTKAGIFQLDTLAVLFPVLAWVASIFTFVYSMILVFKTFTGKYKREKVKREVHEAPAGMLISPVILASFVIIIFFYPNILSEYLLKPALVSVLPMLYLEQINVEISAWHGWNTELFMTIGVVVFGTILYKTVKHWGKPLVSMLNVLSLNDLYDRTFELLESGSNRATKRYMTGSIRTYFLYIFAFFAAVLNGALLLLHGVQFDFSNNRPVELFDVGLAVAIVAGAITVLLTNNRIAAIVALSLVGYLVTMFYVIFRAPDLALTQMVVETVTTVLFLLCFYFLPKMKRTMEKVRFKAVNLFISIAAGLTVTVLALSSNSHKLFDSISFYYNDAFELAGAKNIVNAILVDFRGFDTMLEISVLVISGLAVYTFIRLRQKGSEQDEAK